MWIYAILLYSFNDRQKLQQLQIYFSKGLWYSWSHDIYWQIRALWYLSGRGLTLTGMDTMVVRWWVRWWVRVGEAHLVQIYLLGRRFLKYCTKWTILALNLLNSRWEIGNFREFLYYFPFSQCSFQSFFWLTFKTTSKLDRIGNSGSKLDNVW